MGGHLGFGVKIEILGYLGLHVGGYVAGRIQGIWVYVYVVIHGVLVIRV